MEEFVLELVVLAKMEDVRISMEGLVIDDDQATPSAPPAPPASPTSMGAVAPGNELSLRAGCGAECDGYRCMRIAVIGDLHPQLVYNRYRDSDVHPPGKIRFDIEAKYIRCEGIDLLPYVLA